MSDHTYRVIEIVGSSPDSIDAAIRNAISRAAETIRGLDWFEVSVGSRSPCRRRGRALPGDAEGRLPNGRRVGPSRRQAAARERTARRTPAPAGIHACARPRRPGGSTPPSRRSPPGRPPRTGSAAGCARSRTTVPLPGSAQPSDPPRPAWPNPGITPGIGIEW